jgi:putative SOS response-associated peptidase YedK
MCGRLVHTLTREGYATYLDLSVPEVDPNYDVRPTDTLPVIRMGEGGLEGSCSVGVSPPGAARFCSETIEELKSLVLPLAQPRRLSLE